ncbi:hypothetical protein QP028_14445 [Corynebacterium suedekumii]|nr:hypothetical protein QP028_14445 [Corynebacterium suedekumii]
MTYPGQGDGHGPDEPRDEYPPYPSTPHPEDNLGYAGHQQYGQYSDYNAYDTGGAAPATGTGKVHVMQAVSWAFKAIFRSWPLWILGALAFFVLTFLLSFIFNIGNATAADPTAVNVEDIVVAVVAVVVSVLIYNAALRQVDNRTVGWGGSDPQRQLLAHPRDPAARTARRRGDPHRDRTAVRPADDQHGDDGPG